jgi:hypothetical protein
MSGCMAVTAHLFKDNNSLDDSLSTAAQLITFYTVNVFFLLTSSQQFVVPK